MRNSQSYPTTVFNERMRHLGGGVKTYSDPSYIFSECQDPQIPLDLRHCHPRRAMGAIRAHKRGTGCIYGPLRGRRSATSADSDASRSSQPLQAASDVADDDDDDDDVDDCDDDERPPPWQVRARRSSSGGEGRRRCAGRRNRANGATGRRKTMTPIHRIASCRRRRRRSTAATARTG